MRRTLRAVLALSFLLACACSEPRREPQGGGRDASAGDTVRIVFSLPGDDIGSPESAAVLDRVGSAIAAQGAGEVLGSGFGMGRMELSVRLRDPGSRALLEEIVRKEYPAARYRIEQRGP